MTQKNFVLSGGGCRAFAQLGAIKALKEHDIYPNKIAGTSAGAYFGAFLADGFSPEEIKEMFIKELNYKMLVWNGFHMGLASMKKIRNFLEKNLRHSTFEEMQLPLFITATNFISGRQKIFKKGNIIDALIAASSFPVLFPPMVIDNIPYIDGGISNNLPIEPFRKHKKETICIYVNPIKILNPKESLLEITDRVFQLSFREMVGRSAAGCFLYIEPKELNSFGLFDVHKVNEIFDIGYNYTNKILQENKK